MRKIFLATLFLFIFSQLSAQIIQIQPRAGFKAGINTTNLTISEIDDQNSRFGYHVGLFTLFPIKNRFGIQLETNYSTKGNAITTNVDFPFGTAPQTEVEIYLDYLDIPVIAVYQLNRFITFRGGIYGNILLSSEVNAIGEDIVPAVQKDQFSSFGFGFLAGMGFNVHPITLGIRYSHGLTAIGQEDLPGQFLNESRHSVFQMYVEYSFRKSRDVY